MKEVIVGVFATYEDANDAVHGLEVAGIMGEEVELITEIDEDAETVHSKAETSTQARETNVKKIARLFGGDGEATKGSSNDATDVLPEYLGDEEFYGTHIRQGGAVVIVRPASETSARRAKSILRAHDAKIPGDEQSARVQSKPKP